jgi:hypothetical protein
MKMKIITIALCALTLSSGLQAASTNLALTGTASQSSTGFGGSASRAIDGNTNGSWSNNSVTHTGQEQGAWWQVDLGLMTQIDQVDIWSRTDCCETRLSDFTVSIWDTASANQLWSENFAGTASAHVIFNMSSIVGQIVKVQLNGTNYLSLAEVQVSAVPVPAAAFLFAPALLGFLGLRRKAKNSVA